MQVRETKFRIGGYRAGQKPAEAKHQCTDRFKEKQLPSKVNLRQYRTEVEEQVDNSCVANALIGAYKYFNYFQEELESNDIVAVDIVAVEILNFDLTIDDPKECLTDLESTCQNYAADEEYGFSVDADPDELEDEREDEVTDDIEDYDLGEVDEDELGAEDELEEDDELEDYIEDEEDELEEYEEDDDDDF